MIPVLGFDNGRSMVKSATEKAYHEFPSAVSEARELKNPQNKAGDLEIVYNGQRWFVGSLAEREGLYIRYGFGDSKGEETTLLQFFATCWIHNIYGQVNVSMGTPVDAFTKEERSKIRGILKKEHHFTVKGSRHEGEIAREEHWTVDVQNVLISQECVSGYWADPQDGATYTIDAGAKTTNYASFDKDRTYIEKESGTLDIGWEGIKANEELDKIDDNELDEEEIQKIAAAYANRIVDEVQKRGGWNRPRRTVQLIGGLADKIEDAIRKTFPKAYVVPEPRRANAIGYYKLGRRIFK